MVTSKEVMTLLGHSHWVRTVCFSSDGRMLASGSRDKTIKLWEIKNEGEKQTGKCLKTLSAHEHSVWSVKFKDSSTLVSGGQDNTIRVWNVETLQETKVIKAHGHTVNSLSFSPD